MKERILRLVAKGKISINLRGLEYLQSLPGEDEELAWKRLRPKLSYTGRQLDEVTLMVPSGGADNGWRSSASSPSRPRRGCWFVWGERAGPSWLFLPNPPKQLNWVSVRISVQKLVASAQFSHFDSRNGSCIVFKRSLSPSEPTLRECKK
jgi:hypothetical protein